MKTNFKTIHTKSPVKTDQVMNIVRFQKPRTEAHPFFNVFEDFFNRPLGELAFNHGGQSFRPAVNVVENPDHFQIELAAPGLNKSDFRLHVEKETLTISGETRSNNEENKPNYTRREFSLHSFNRSFTLPESIDTDQISASYENGILLVRLPKRAEAQEKPARTIEIA